MKRPKKRAKFVCGTPAGYIRHLRNYERPCSRCLVGSETYSDLEILRLVEDFQNWSSAQRLWKTHQLSHERFEQIFAEQGHRCACCSNTKSGEVPWNVDHDHQTGLIRGILCSDCNAGIAQLGDNSEGVLRAAAYLQAHHARGGYEKAPKPPKAQKPFPEASAVMRRCFDLFKQAVPRSQVVIILKLTPALVEEIYALWSTRGGESSPVSRHIFQIAKDSPTRFMCACGYSAPWNSPDEMSDAIKCINAHIEEADNHPEAEWKRLEMEENERRLQEKHFQEKEHRQRIARELQRKKTGA